MHKHNTRLTGIGDGEAVGRLDVVHVRHQVERGFRGVRAGVVQEDCQTKGSVLLISVSDEQTAWTEGKETHDDVKKKKKEKRKHRRIIHNLTADSLIIADKRRDMKWNEGRNY